MPAHDLPLRSLAYATDIDVLPVATTVVDRGEYVVVRTPSNPTFYWGNFLLFRRPPKPGERERWERLFEREHGQASARGSDHVALGWDTVEGELGSAAELVAAGYELLRLVGLVAEPHELFPHPRANTDVAVRLLDPAAGADASAWDAVLELQVASRDQGHGEDEHRRFLEARMSDRRQRFGAGEGGWFVAELDGRVVASCGVIVTEGRARFQAVDTAQERRRQGIARRLVHDAGRAALDRFGADRLVIVAEADYHALAVYESLGFVAREHTAGACWWPGAPNAPRHPVYG